MARTPCVSQFIQCYLSISLSRDDKGSEKYGEVKLGGGGACGSYLARGLMDMLCTFCKKLVNLFIYLRFYLAFNPVQVISQRVVGRAEETSTYSSLGLCTVNCRPTANNYQLSHLRLSQGSNPGLRGGRRVCYHSATVAP